MKNQDSCFKFLKVGAMTILISFSLAGCDKCVDDSERFDALMREVDDILVELYYLNTPPYDCTALNAKLLELDDAYDEICDPDNISSTWASHLEGQSVEHVYIDMKSSASSYSCQ